MVGATDGEFVPGKKHDGLDAESEEHACRYRAHPRRAGEDNQQGSGNPEGGHPDRLDSEPQSAAGAAIEYGNRIPAIAGGYTQNRERAGPDDQARPDSRDGHGCQPEPARTPGAHPGPERQARRPGRSPP